MNTPSTNHISTEERQTHLMDETYIAEVVAERIAALRDRAIDRKAHVTYLESLLAATDELDDVEVPSGVSGQVALALVDDVEWLRAALAGETHIHRTPYPNAYAERRRIDANAGRQRAATKSARWNLP
jgi:hypothetical protein